MRLRRTGSKNRCHPRDLEQIHAWGWTIEFVDELPDSTRGYERTTNGTLVIQVARRLSNFNYTNLLIVPWLMGQESHSYAEQSDEDMAAAIAAAIKEVQTTERPTFLQETWSPAFANVASRDPLFVAWHKAMQIKPRFLDHIKTELKWRLLGIGASVGIGVVVSGVVLSKVDDAAALAFKLGRQQTLAARARFFENLAEKATRNASSTKLVLGKFDEGGVGYTKVAAHYKASYFKIEDWRALRAVLSDDELWQINETFLKQQIRAGKEIIFSHDPIAATGWLSCALKFSAASGNA